MNEYCTLDQLREYLTSSGVAMGLGDDDRLRQHITQASRLVDSRSRRWFYPRIETRYFNYQKARELIVDDDLLDVSSLTAGGTSIDLADFWLYPLNAYPKWMIQINKSKSVIFSYDATLQRAVTVIGTWGWHDDWGNAWADSLDGVQDDPEVSAAATTITVAEGEGADADGYSPRFSPGQLLKIEDEYVAVTGVNWSNETLTVQRGVNGTTAAVHLKDVPIYVYRPAGVAVLAALRVAKMIYETKSAVGGIIALPGMDGAIMKAKMDELLADLDLPVRPDSLMEFV